MNRPLSDLIAATQCAADVEDLRERLVQRATKHFEAARGALFLLSEIPPAILPILRQNPMFQALAERHAPLHDGTLTEFRALSTRDDHGHSLVGPVIENGQLIGSLAFTRQRDAQPFDDQALADLSALCLHVSTRLTQLQLQQQALKEQELKLSGRETQIAQLVAQGLTNKQIAVELGISSETVKAALKAIFGKTGVKSRAQLVACLPRL
jgi:DNA-binding CsgD family transcriptional regulator